MADRVRIVGGGMTGLSLALRLAREGRTVEVHEARPELGGLSGPATVAGVPVDRFYHCVLPGDERLLALFEEVGIADRVRWTRTRTGFFVDDRLLDMTTSMDFLRFPAIGLVDRIRLAWTLVHASYLADGKALDQVPLPEYLVRHGGRRLYERIWKPLLDGKLGEDHQRFAASFIWATIQRMMSARRAKSRAESLGHVVGGYATVLSALREELERRGGRVLAPSRVEGLRLTEGGAELRREDSWTDAAPTVLCVPAPVAAAWCRDVDCDDERLRNVEYLGVVCEVLVLEKSLTPYYVLNPATPGLPFTGVIETSNLTGRDAYGGKALVYLPRYRSAHHPDWSRDDAQIHAENFEGLRRISPSFDESDVVGWAVHRARSVQPVHHLGYARSLPPVRLAPRLAYLSTAQIHPWPVFNDEVVGLVDRRLAEVLATLDEGGRA